MSYWRERAVSAIETAIATINVDFQNLSASDKQQLKCAMPAAGCAYDAAYPFGVRKNHPYQVWLDERQKALEMLGIVNKKIRSKDELPLFDLAVPGQQSLF
ncbi:hypothetical protein [Nostoc sp. JL23]|uniref:hypothetical protein n=1 Tax=Nostoc sp. JL23 TaxID=2815394 RepID=UPI001D9C1D37|nr:hypothetical protein [Nostoc sp. JL23]MBN3875266.1 hypothetical protein [Nostoc sp. JL23]